MFRALATAALLAITVTAAQAESATPESVVTYGDLNLSKPQDAAILADRLQVAAKEVCLAANDTKAPIRKILVRRCVDMAVTRATAQIRDEIETSQSRTLQASLVSVRQMVASTDMP